jgi:hypothetical protein
VLIAPGAAQPAWLATVRKTPGGTVAVNRTALPRAWVAYGWRNAHDAGDALALTTDSTARALRQRPVIEGVRAAPSGPTPPSTAASVVDDNSERVTVHAVARLRGFLVLDDSAYPGWQASVDGHPVAWHPANENFRAVPIGAGSHTVVFRYDPSSVKVGAVISVLSILALLGIAAAGAILVRRRPRSGVVQPAEPVPAPEPRAPVSS